MENTYLALCFSKNVIRSAQMGFTGKKPKIERIIYNELPFSFALTEFEKKNFVRNLSSAIDKVVETFSFKPDSLLLTLNRDMTFCRKLEIEKEIPQDEERSFIEWEVKQRLGSSHSEYLFDWYELEVENLIYKYLLLILFRKSVFETIMESVKKSGLTLDLLDVDFFAGQNALLFNYSISPDKTAALFKSEREVFTVSIIMNNEFTDFFAFSLNEADGLNYIESSSTDYYFNMFKEYYVEDKAEFTESKFPFADKIFIYGDSLDNPIFKKIMEKNEKITEIVNPFLSFDIEKEVKKSTLFKDNPGQFTDVVGLLVRKISA